MAKVEAVQCDACDHLDLPVEGATIPGGWLLVDIDQEGAALLRGAVYCSWACLADVARNRVPGPPVRRKRRTREQIEADEAAAREAESV